MNWFSGSQYRQGLRSILAAGGAIAALGSASCARAVDTEAMARSLTQLDDAWSQAAATRNADSVGSFYAADAIAYRAAIDRLRSDVAHTGRPPELDDIQNRLDFAERVLAQVKARDALPGPR